MMQNKTKWAGFFLAIVFLLSFSGAYAIRPVDQGISRGKESAPAPDKIFKKRIEVFKAIRGNVLYTERNTYDLTNVTVTYSTNKMQENPTDDRKMVGLIYLDEILKKVVVYP